MKQLFFLILCTALWGTSPAWAMRAHDYIDADQRTKVTLPGEQDPPVLTLERQLQASHAMEAAEVAEAALLPTPQQTQAAAVRPVASPVPEPSGVTMLGLGLLMLFLMPYKKRTGEAIAPDPEKHYTL
ncbi:hypothetical protein KW842_21925 [Duganella sp. sic0402]|uniref:hypothetical protein n=1 Tax=Duganella sp. sic0402 TaxID=2854786 RepID=UPI001C47CE45|nr:hypothetical protein [Duganella sp. sic0402]MBV7538438.1 hypothetical protein [Duganella sp. sic0402]